MSIRLRNPISRNPFSGLRNLTREQKIMIGIGAGTLLVGMTVATVAWAADADPPPLKKSIEVGPGCTTFAVESEQQLRDDLRIRLRAAAQQGPIDPLQLTSKYIKWLAPRCPTYPSNTETPGQVKLFATVYITLLDVMRDDNYLSDLDYPTWYGMLTTWAAGQGVSAEEL